MAKNDAPSKREAQEFSRSFYITSDRDSEVELRDLYDEIAYTIIDDVLSLTERLPGDLSETDDVTELQSVCLNVTQQD